MYFSEELHYNPNDSHVEVFQKLFAKFISLQKQNKLSCHGDKFLKDRIMTAVDIPSAHTAIQDRIPTTAQHLTNLLANKLFENPKTAGSAYGERVSWLLQT